MAVMLVQLLVANIPEAGTSVHGKRVHGMCVGSQAHLLSDNAKLHSQVHGCACMVVLVLLLTAYCIAFLYCLIA